VGAALLAAAFVEELEDLVDGAGDVVVDDDGVEAVRETLLGVGLVQSPFQPLGVGAAAAVEEPLALHGPGRRFDIDDEGVGEPVADGEGALDVDLDEDVVAGGEVLLDRGSGGALEVAVDLEPFQKPVVVAQLFEGVARHEVVVASFDLVWSGRPVGDRHREPE